jgi:ACS family sodium-dependent inorganic phosphate cotransporter-like MFS transporter 5
MKGWGTRHTFILMSFFMMVLNQCWRINLSVAIVAMVNQGGGSADDESSIGNQCPLLEETSNSNSSKKADFNWNAQQQGVVLGAFFYGFIVSMIPGGYLSERYSSKWVIFGASLGASVCSLLSPVAAKYGDYAGFVAIKVVQGLVQAPLIPGSITIISCWIPPIERSFGTSMIFGGQGLGSVLSFALSGYLADNFGWEWDFYSFGILGLIFCFFWTFLVYNQPSDHPRISQEEKDFIQDGIGILKTQEKVPLPPYKQILTSLPFWALSVTFVCSAWGFYTLLTNVPTYLNNIQHIPLTLVTY